MFSWKRSFKNADQRDIWTVSLFQSFANKINGLSSTYCFVEKAVTILDHHKVQFHFCFKKAEFVCYMFWKGIFQAEIVDMFLQLHELFCLICWHIKRMWWKVDLMHKILQWREIPFIYVSIVAFGLRDSIIVKIIIVCKLFDNICTSSSLSNLHPPCSFSHDLKLKRWTLIDYEFFMVRVRQCLNRRDIRLMYWRLKTSHLLQGTFTWF